MSKQEYLTEAIRTGLFSFDCKEVTTEEEFLAYNLAILYGLCKMLGTKTTPEEIYTTYFLKDESL